VLRCMSEGLVKGEGFAVDASLIRANASEADNGPAIQTACSQFIICRELGLFANTMVAIDGAKFKGVNAREKNYTRGI